MRDQRRGPRRLPVASRHASLPPAVRPALLLALVLAACAGGGGSSAIEALVTKEITALNAKDLSTLSQIWSPDPDILLFDVPAPGRFQGWERIARVYKEFFDRCSELKVTVRNVRAHAQGSLGYATYDWSMNGRMGEYTLRDHGEATAIYRQEKGGWRLIHLHYSAAPPGQPEEPEGAPPAATPTPAHGATASPSPAASPGGRPAPGKTVPPSPAPAASPVPSPALPG